MRLDAADLKIFWAIVEEGPLLDKVEEFLIHAGESGLQQKLNKLQQDAGVAVAEDLTVEAMNPQPMDDGNPEPFVGPALAEAYQPVSPQRLAILREVQHALEAYSSEHAPAYDQFLATSNALAPMASAPRPIGPVPTL